MSFPDYYDQRLQQKQREFGAARFEIGRLLCHIKERQHWRGKAASFNEYLESRRVNSSAARQYMRVARAFIIDLQLDEAVLAELYDVNMSTLEQAAKVLTADNAEDVIAKVTSLSEKDAKYELSQLDEVDGPFDAGRAAPAVASLLAKFRALPHELQIEAMTSLRLSVPPPAGASG